MSINFMQVPSVKHHVAAKSILSNLINDLKGHCQKKMPFYHQKEKCILGNTHIEHPEKRMENEEMWQEVREVLTEKQWHWVYYHIIQGMKLKEIAEMKGVSVEAVKSWGKEARRKLREKGWDSFERFGTTIVVIRVWNHMIQT